MLVAQIYKFTKNPQTIHLTFGAYFMLSELYPQKTCLKNKQNKNLSEDRDIARILSNTSSKKSQ